VRGPAAPSSKPNFFQNIPRKMPCCGVSRERPRRLTRNDICVCSKTIFLSRHGRVDPLFCLPKPKIFSKTHEIWLHVAARRENFQKDTRSLYACSKRMDTQWDERVASLSRDPNQFFFKSCRHISMLRTVAKTSKEVVLCCCSNLLKKYA
jgi:hypothetical protein